MARIISIANQKGGCGKTTTAVNLSAGIALFGMKVLLIDMDPQGNASLTLGINIEDIPLSMSDILLDAQLDMTYNIYQKGCLYIAPSSPALAYAESRLHMMKNKTGRLVSKLAKASDLFDYIIIDCPPNIGILTTNALMASSWVIIPVDTGFYSLIGVRQLLARLNEVQAHTGACGEPALPEILGLLLTKYDETHPFSGQIMNTVKSSFADKLFDTVIRQDVRLSEAPSHLKTIYEYDGDGRGAMDYLRFSREVIFKTQTGGSNG